MDSLVSEPLGNSRPVCCEGLQVQEKRCDQLLHVGLQRESGSVTALVSTRDRQDKRDHEDNLHGPEHFGTVQH